MKSFCFTVDDNIRCFEELTRGRYDSIFMHPYLGMYKRLHEKFALKVQLNLFYETAGFTLSEMTDRHRDEWQENSDWLKLSFHSKLENERPYEFSSYSEVFCDCDNVNRQILRFASSSALGRTTTVHYCLATGDGLQALKDNGIVGLLGLYGTEKDKSFSYRNTPEECKAIRRGETVMSGGIAYAGIDIVLNNHPAEDILSFLDMMKDRDFIKVMIHEQYFYPDYPAYQKNFEEKLNLTFEWFINGGYRSVFFEEQLPYST
ncbi:MAG: hypothetical protein IJF13_02940 [Clostridia bacterium]|nr:hypothetical protein [Clostridia bacterium]